VVSNPVGQVFGDTAYVKSLVSALVSGYSQHGQIDLKIVLPQSKQLEMEEFFKNSLSAELAKGLSVEYSKQFNAGFKVGPKDNSFNVGFTESDFINFFKAYLRPKTAGILFEQV
jgi:V/A-type H+-transporting ATPase subunit E